MRHASRLRVVILCGMAVLCLAAAGMAPAVAAGAAPDIAGSEVALAEGLAALQLGRDEEALAKLTAAVDLDPRAGSPRYWRGFVLLRLHRPREAAADLEASLAAKVPPEVARQRVVADLAAARGAAGVQAGAAAAPPAPAGERGGMALPEWRFDRVAFDDRGAWEGSAGAALAADSNPNLLAASLDLPTPGGKPAALVRGAQSDGLAELGLRLAWYPWHDRVGWDPAVSVEAGQSVHRDFRYLDFGQVRAVVQLARGQDPQGFLAGALGSARLPFGGRRFSTLLQAGFSDSWLNGAGFLRSWEGAAAFVLPESAAAAARLDLGYSRRRFGGQPLADPRRDGEDLSAALAQTFYLGRADRSFGIAVRALDRRARRAFAARAGEASAALALPLAPRLHLLLEGAVRRDRYRYPESNLLVLFGPARRDTTWRGGAALAWAMAPRLVWTLRGTYTSRTSNVDLGAGLPDLGFRRYVIGLGANWALR
ncbi:MAG TPA: hypothetical protein VHQ90_24980 [Thermoanaerobaculia bacterium]|nr:hypothetical protein [Thermoanaerobaculia bacterium]